MNRVSGPTWDGSADWQAVLRTVRRRLRPRRNALNFGPPLEPDVLLSQSYIVIAGATVFWLSFL